MAQTRIFAKKFVIVTLVAGIGFLQEAQAQTTPPASDTSNTYVRSPWARTTELTLTGGQTTTAIQTGGNWRGIIRTKLSKRTEASLGIAHYTLQDAMPDFGVVSPAGESVRETQVRPEIVFRPTPTVTITGTGLYRNTMDGSSYILRSTATVTIKDPVSVLFGMRPSYDETIQQWSNAVEVGLVFRLPLEQALTVRMLQTSRRELEPPVTFLANYDASITRRLRIRAGAARGNGTMFRYTSVFGNAVAMLTPGIGVTIDYTRRTGTFDRHNVNGGIVIGF